MLPFNQMRRYRNARRGTKAASKQTVVHAGVLYEASAVDLNGGHWRRPAWDVRVGSPAAVGRPSPNAPFPVAANLGRFAVVRLCIRIGRCFVIRDILFPRFSLDPMTFGLLPFCRNAELDGMLGLAARLLGTVLIALAGASCAAQSNLQAEPIAASATQQRGCSAAAAYSKDNHGVALLVIQRGQLVCENYTSDYARDTPHALFSGTKGLNGLMAAAAAADGMLSLDEPVANTLTEWKTDPVKSRITIRQLLSLSSGLTTVGPRAAPGFAEAAATPAQYPAEERFAYGPVVFQTFGEVMRRKLERFPS